MTSDNWLILWLVSLIGFAVNNATYPDLRVISVLLIVSVFVSSIGHAIQSTKEFYNN